MAVWGIMGSSFDPIHLGHLQMAESAMRQMQFAGVLFIPTGDPPHKSHLAPARHRLRMVELAIRDRQNFVALDIEIKREQVTYTVDTLNQLHRQRPDDQFVYIVGADTLLVIETWHTFERVPPLLRAVACVPRPGVPDELLGAHIEHLGRRYGLSVERILERGPDISSTDVRLAVERALPIQHMVPAEVEAYIKRHALYRDPMLTELMGTLTSERYRHTLGVERTAVKLAQKNGIDPYKARVAALLHDCAKCMPEKDMLELLREHGMLPRFQSDRTRTLMHAAAGMILAREKYGVTDPEILGAIRWHTTGHAGMTKLEKLIYLADVIEPNRRPFPALSAIRAATWRSLNEGMRMAAERTLKYLDQRGVLPDQNTLELLREYDDSVDVEEK